MQRRMTEEEIIWAFDDAIEQGQIYMVYQPGIRGTVSL